MRRYDEVVAELEREAAAIGRRLRSAPRGSVDPAYLEELRRLRSRMMLPLLLAALAAVWAAVARRARRSVVSSGPAASDAPRRLA